jgi:exodeoxyribonuclease V gamma subunit
VTIARIQSLAEDAADRRQNALHHLTTLLNLYDRGMREPLPLYCFASAAYAEAANAGRDPVAAGRRAWTSPWNFDKEDKELEHQLVLGAVKTFDELLAEPPRLDEQGEGWETTETTRLGRYARRMWAGPLASENVTAR